MADLLSRITDFQLASENIEHFEPVISGRLTRMIGLTLEAKG